MALTIPTEPKELRPDLPPPGYRVKLATFNDRRNLIVPRLQLAHTNGASGEGSIESSWNWMQRNTDPGYIYGDPPGKLYKTIPHFQVDRDGDAAMLLELNRQGIAAARANPFCISYETADRGYDTDSYPTGSSFTEPQLQALATGFAYCSMLFKIALDYPATWDGNGSASHTEPFGYPYWTISDGKPCPGDIKKAQVRDIVLPHARKIVAAWTGESPPPPPEDELTENDIERIAQRFGLVDVNGNPITVGEAVVDELAKPTLNVVGTDGAPTKANLFSVVGWTWGKVRGLK